MTVTLNDVARAAGVSKSAASKVLGRNAPDSSVRIGLKTRRRIEAAAQRLRYLPNVLAQGLRAGQTRSVGLLWSLSGTAAYAAVVRDLTIAMQNRGRLVHPFDHGFDPARTDAALRDLLARGVQSLVIHANPALLRAPALGALLAAFPAVVVVSPWSLDCPFDLIVQDRHAAYHQIADHLAASGRVRPAYISSLAGNRTKIAALRDRLAAHRPRIAPLRLVDLLVQHSEATGLDFVNALDASFPDTVPFDALVCGHDEGALAAIAWLRRRDRRVPDDVAVIGFNNSDFGAFVEPPLATVERHDRQLVLTIEQLLMQRLDHADRPRETRHLSMTFKWRCSAGGRDPAASVS